MNTPTPVEIPASPAASWPAHGLARLFAARVEAEPDALALAFGTQALTRAQLERRANRLAHHLQGAGVAPGDLVGVFLERSVDWVVALLAVLKAGAAYVPLDPDYPRERLRFMFEDSGARVVIAHSALRDRLPEARLREVLLDAERDQIDARPERAPRAHAGAASLAYVTYTSGSTGRPKGVCVPQRAVARLVLDSDYVQLGPADRVAQASNASFDAATFEVWGALLNGARLVGIPREVTLDADELARRLAEERISVLFLTTALFNQTARQTPGALRGLRCVLFGGEAVQPHWVRQVLRHGPPERLLHVYGPTENTTFSSWHHVRALAADATTVPIGRAVAHSSLHVLDERLEPVAPGGTGELYTGGDGVADGYWMQARLTAERFLPDPFGAPGGRLYRTGDLVRLLEDGALEFVGRVDQQVKIRGFRIEPGEIEERLREHPAVHDAVVLAREDQPGERRLWAYVVARPGARLEHEPLRRFLEHSLPAFMLPAGFVPLASLPLSPNGKVDRHALQQAALPSLLDGEPAEAPCGATEQALARLWSELLGVARPSRADDFFELGGHSLLVLQLVARVREAFGVGLSVRDVFEHSALVEQAALVEQRLGRAEPPRVTSPRAATGDAPLSFSQERIWFIQQLHPDNIAYQFQATLRLRGRLVLAALEGALGRLVERHEIFRTTFPVVDGRPVQRVHAPWAVHLDVLDLSVLPGAVREDEARRVVRERCRERMPLDRLPLVRWTLLRVAADDHVLIHVEHHLLHDGWSFNLVLGELARLYAALHDGRAPELDPPGQQFADFARWQREFMEGEEGRRQLEYWSERLRDAPQVLELPRDHPRPAVQSHRGAALREELPLELCRRLRAFVRAQGGGVTLYMTLLAGFLALLRRYTGQADLLVGAGIANRRSRDTESVVGMIVNAVVLRVDLAGDPTFLELVARARAATLGAYVNQDLPFERVVDALRPERDLSHNPFFQATFSFHDAPLPRLAFPELEVDVVEGVSNGSAKFDLNVIAIPRAEQRVGRGGEEDQRITLVWEYATDLFEDATMRRMLGHYLELLSGAVALPDRRVSELPLLAAHERRSLVGAWAGVTPAAPAAVGAHELVEEWARRRPDGAALDWDGGRWTYAELNARANGMARRLRALGVRRETCVALACERTPALVLGLLAALKAGATYVPLDPAWPRERMHELLVDARARVVLTERGYAARVPSGVPLLELDEREAPGDDGLDLGVRPFPEQLAYIIYTSGSTGRPKGVMLAHRGLVLLAEDLRRRLGTRPGDKVLQYASPAFDATVWEVWMALAAGATLRPAGSAPLLGPDLARVLNEHAITHLTLTPTALSALPLGAYPSLRVLIAAGEACPQELAARWCGGRSFFDAYGPTEVTVCASIDVHAEGRPLTIGRPFAGARVHVLDAELNLLPPGVAGELCVGGPGVARGYLGRPDLTALRFVPDPFSGQAGARLYRTGDRACHAPDGRVRFLGRLDRQIKLRGRRIEPAEVEAALRRHPALAEALVVAREHAGAERLVAYVVVRDGAPPWDALVPELRGLLRACLPAYMAPAAYVALAALPLTPVGKLDLDALPAPPAPAPSGGVAPRTPVEQLVAAAWCDVLGLERVGVHDNFFDLGGDSMRSTRIAQRLHQAGLPVQLRDLFAHQSVAELAAALAERGAHAAPGRAPGAVAPGLELEAGELEGLLAE